MYSIGKLSLMTRLSVKTLRHYHEAGILVPDHIDEDSGYRYYRPTAVERARVIVQLRELGFGLQQIETILEDCEEDQDVIAFLEERSNQIEAELKILQSRRANLGMILDHARRMRNPQATGTVVEKVLPGFLLCGLRKPGRWDQIGALFGTVARRAGRHISGPALALCYDGYYKDEAADYEAGFPVRRIVPGIAKYSIECRELPEQAAVTLLHTGPYAELGRSYEIVLEYMDRRGYEMQLPTREVYLKGPGMILRGNPAKYVTEIQIPIAEPAGEPSIR